jgi:large subunit ribosomal protein L16
VDPRLPGCAGVEEAAEVRMGSGKARPEFWVCKIKPGRILFEVDGVPRELAQEGDAAGRR